MEKPNLHTFISKHNLAGKTIEDVVDAERGDRQYKALESLWHESKESRGLPEEVYYFLVLANALICYQLSGKGEDYWEEFARTVPACRHCAGFATFDDVLDFFTQFLPSSKSNKRLVQVKLKRLARLAPLWQELVERRRVAVYTNNLEKLLSELAETMSQPKSAKTLVFAIKMYGYAGMAITGKSPSYPQSISIPIDSRLTKLYTELLPEGTPQPKSTELQEFYTKLAQELNMPPLHLDALLWAGSSV